MPRMLVLVGAVLILTALTQIGGAALLIAIAAALLLRFGKLAIAAIFVGAYTSLTIADVPSKALEAVLVLADAGAFRG
jgi:hypothetical protein